jgi:enoyl-CoA hydratase/carnithine racemase
MSASGQRPEPLVKATRDGSIMTIVLDRPQRLNSLNLQMIHMLKDLLEKARSTDECRCVLLYGAGDRGFCAGGDIAD